MNASKRDHGGGAERGRGTMGNGGTRSGDGAARRGSMGNKGKAAGSGSRKGSMAK
jgi:hypothetical protein